MLKETHAHDCDQLIICITIFYVNSHDVLKAMLVHTLDLKSFLMCPVYELSWKRNRPGFSGIQKKQQDM